MPEILPEKQYSYQKVVCTFIDEENLRLEDPNDVVEHRMTSEDNYGNDFRSTNTNKIIRGCLRRVCQIFIVNSEYFQGCRGTCHGDKS